MLEELKKLDDTFYQIKKNLDYLEYIDAINFDTEKKNFLGFIKKGERYNPIFMYNPINNKKFNEYLKILDGIDLSFLKKYKSLYDIYSFEYNDIKNRVYFIQSIGSENITTYGESLFGKLDELFIKESEKKIVKMDEILPKSGKEFMDKGEVEANIKELLLVNNIQGWKIEFYDGDDIATILPFKKTIRLRNQKLYDRLFTQILLAHEISGHVTQNDRAGRQNLSILQYGFGCYETLSEGFAMWQEVALNKMVWNRAYIYYLSIYYALQYDFYGVYMRLIQFLNKDTAFSLAYRSKRGLSDTSIPGSNLKEKVYLEGLIFMKNASEDDRHIISRAKFDYRFLSHVTNLI